MTESNELTIDWQEGGTSGPGEIDSLRLYLREISRYPLLPRFHEKWLFERLEAGDQAAKTMLIHSHLRLVVAVARAFRHRGLPYQDLIQEGNIGLQTAVERFDPEREARLSTYAVPLIASRMDQAVANCGRTIRLPANVLRKLAQVHRMERRLYQWLGREPTNRDIARELSISIREVEALKGQALSPVSLSKPIGEEGEELEDLLPDDRGFPVEDQIAMAQDRAALRDALAQLSRRARDVIELRYGLGGQPPRTLEEIADRWGVTRQRISQVEQEALTKLAEALGGSSGEDRPA